MADNPPSCIWPNQAQRKVFDALRKEGVKGLYYLDGDHLLDGRETRRWMGCMRPTWVSCAWRKSSARLWKRF